MLQLEMERPADRIVQGGYDSRPVWPKVSVTPYVAYLRWLNGGGQPDFERDRPHLLHVGIGLSRLEAREISVASFAYQLLISAAFG